MITLKEVSCDLIERLTGFSGSVRILGNFIVTNGHEYQIPFYKEGIKKPKQKKEGEVTESFGFSRLPIQRIDNAIKDKRTFDEKVGLHKVCSLSRSFLMLSSVLESERVAPVLTAHLHITSESTWENASRWESQRSQGLTI